MNVVIIGNGAAALSAAQNIRKNTSDNIIMLSDEKVAGYFRPTLSHYLCESSLGDRFYIKKEEWYRENNIDLRLGQRVININTLNKQIESADKETISYDKLILANGGSSIVPSINNVNLKNVYTLRTLENAENIKNRMKMSKNVVIIGGGLLGLEAAWAMKQTGLNVSVIEKFPRILPRQLDAGASVIFESIINKEGINVLLNEGITGIIGDKEAQGVMLESGHKIQADLILISIGMIPNIGLVSGTEIKTNRGIIVNSKMETNVGSIYACGDSAEFNGRIYGNWTAAMDMGKTAGLNVCDIETEFKDMVPSSIFNGMNTSLFSCGDVNNGPFEDILISGDMETGITKKLFVKNGKLSGGILIGDTKDSIKLLNGIKKGLSKEKMKAAF